MKRKYELKRRAERQAETRQRIVEAAVALHFALNPAPDVAALDLREALRALYDWYERTEGPVTLFARDAYRYPEIWAERLRVLDEIADRLARPLGRRRIVRAAAGHAVAFETWQSLVRHQGVSNAQAADAMVAFIHSV